MKVDPRDPPFDHDEDYGTPVWKPALDEYLMRVREENKAAMMARQVHNSPPPLDDVGSDVSDMLDQEDPNLGIPPPDPTKMLLEARGKTHGNYREHAEISQHLKDVLRRQRNWEDLTDRQKETLEMVAHKIGRILAGDPNYPDHWDDIAGYATLVSIALTSPQA